MRLAGGQGAGGVEMTGMMDDDDDDSDDDAELDDVDLTGVRA